MQYPFSEGIWNQGLITISESNTRVMLALCHPCLQQVECPVWSDDTVECAVGTGDQNRELDLTFVLQSPTVFLLCFCQIVIVQVDASFKHLMYIVVSNKVI